MTLTAVDCIARGVVNLRANWELIPIQVLQVLLVTVLTLVGLLPPVAVVGTSLSDLFEPQPEDLLAVADSVGAFLARGGQAWLLMTVALLLSSAIWLLAMLVFCYFQSGIYGILRAGDRQARPGRPAGWRWFRTYSMRDLRGYGGLYLWRYFWLLNLALACFSAMLLLPVGLVLLSFWGESRWGLPAALGIGCGGALPLLFGLFVFWFWVALAQADLPRPESGVWLAARRSLKVVGRRLGTLVAFALIGMGIAAVVAIAVFTLSFALPLLAGSSPGVQTASAFVLTLLDWVISSVGSVAAAAVCMALMRSESPQEARS